MAMAAEADQKRSAELHRRMANEAWECDINSELSMIAVSALHEVAIPPIFNCCPHSNYQLFPKLDLEAGLTLLGA